MRGAVGESLRRSWRWPLLALALMLAACQTSSGGNFLSHVGAPVDNLPPPTPPGPTVTEELFQPTVHAILAMSGGFGTANPPPPSRRSGSEPAPRSASPPPWRRTASR